MKKIIVLLVSLVLLTGCVSIQNSSIDAIINETMSTKYTRLYNKSGRGYKYYLPKTLLSRTTDNKNEIIKSKKCDYYLYVDLISYYNKIEFNYEENPNIYYSKRIEKEGKKGVINIYENADDKFLIKVEFNYAYIEVITDKDNLNKSLANSIIIVTSMTYNDDIIGKLLEEGLLSSKEETVDIFDSKDKKNVLEVDDTYIEDDQATKYDDVWIK